MRIVLDPVHRVEHAKIFLSELLAQGPVAVKNIRQAAASAGWSPGVGWAAIKHAKSELGLIAFQQKCVWYWRWPEIIE
jgi:hypothetical protein